MVGAALLWASFGLFSRALLARGLTSATLVTFRAGLAAVAFVFWAWRADAAHGTHAFKAAFRRWPFFALYGLVGVVFFYNALVIAVDRGTVSMAVVLMYTAPAYVTLAAARLFGEPVTSRKRVALVLTFVGVVLVAGLHRGGLVGNPTTILAGLGAGVGYAYYSVAGRLAVDRHPLPVVLAHTFLFGSVISAVTWAPQAARQWPLVAGSAAVAGVVLSMALVTVVIPYTLYLSAFKLIETSRASITASLEPVMATVLAALILGEVPGAEALVGAGLVLAGVVLLQLPEKAGAIRAGGSHHPVEGTGGGLFSPAETNHPEGGARN